MSERFPSVILELIIEYVDWDIITKFLDEYEGKFFWNALCNNHHVPFDFILRREKKICWSHLSENPNVPTWFFEKNKSEIQWWTFCRNPNAPFSLLYEVESKWDTLKSLCSNPSIPFSYWKENPELMDWRLLCSNPSIPHQVFLDNQDEFDKPVRDGTGGLGIDCWGELCRNRGITDEFITSLIESREGNVKKLSWSNLCMNPSISLSFLEKYEGCWNWKEISHCPNLTVEFVEKNIELLPMGNVCSRIKAPVSFFEKHEDRYIWTDLFRNPHIPLDFLKRKDGFSNIEGSTRYWHDACRVNIHITGDFVRKNEQKIDWQSLSCNRIFFSNVAREELLPLLTKIL